MSISALTIVAIDIRGTQSLSPTTVVIMCSYEVDNDSDNKAGHPNPTTFTSMNGLSFNSIPATVYKQTNKQTNQEKKTVPYQ